MISKIILLSLMSSLVHAAVPSPCMKVALTNPATPSWTMVTVNVTNKCNAPVDLQNSEVVFSGKSNVNVTAWGDFGNLSYPDKSLAVSSIPGTNGTYFSTISLHFPVANWSKHILPMGASIQLFYGVTKADYIANSGQVCLGTDPNPTPSPVVTPVPSPSITPLPEPSATPEPSPEPSLTPTPRPSISPIPPPTPPHIIPGKMIGYLPGWKTPPPAASLFNAGYTHIIVAFGVFSTTNPGQIIPAFSTVTDSYIASLQQLGIKVLLSIGGASTSIPNTTVDFGQVLAASNGPASFISTFTQSINSLISEHHFDGIDIDIEHGLSGTGAFASPTGGIATLASIINQLHAQNRDLLISLAPQTANVSATSGFNDTWGNYASLIMQTYSSLSWVGVQIYNTGCTYGINQVCYANTGISPDYSVSLAIDLVQSWPSRLTSGIVTGFQPYIAHLRPDQIVLGYPSPNSSGASDGLPVTSTNVIKRAIKCLQTGIISPTSCDTYQPPVTFNIGGIFNWEVTYDQSNNFNFATQLEVCVKTGMCL